MELLYKKGAGSINAMIKFQKLNSKGVYDL